MNEINVHRCVYPFPIVNFIYHQRYQFAFMTDLGLNKSRYHNSMYDFIYFINILFVDYERINITNQYIHTIKISQHPQSL